MLAGDFKTYVLPLSNRLLRTARQMLQDEEEAKDVLQDIFVKLWQKRDELNKVENLEAFTISMTKNRCLDVLRRRRTIPTENLNKTSVPKLRITESDHFENADSVNHVKRIIAGLPDVQRSIIHLRDIELLEYEEIAEVTKMTTNAIKVNLSRARKKVRDEILRIQNYGITENKHIAGKVL
jgi:RNA polymerase sigma-70 factor (ECF subfamily)